MVARGSEWANAAVSRKLHFLPARRLPKARGHRCLTQQDQEQVQLLNDSYPASPPPESQPPPHIEATQVSTSSILFRRES
ncbi:hypothetical protein E2C01_008589 [Portunus trituberculatus]|uniref:Uncharacterized protein n=1 Tax=Portunus trituberculatus TaxID=210409 RepID=A0A5B7D4W4_PORTR|nr:hypothetical protein [Portunus trituberculatus]